MRHECAAAVVLVGSAAWEIARIIAADPWDGFVPWVSYFISGLLAALFLAASAFFFLRRRSPRLESPAWVLAITAPLAMEAHGLVTRTAKNELGVVYMVAAVLVAFLVKRSYDEGELARSVAHAREARPARR